jgi:hypothetical protein
MISDMVRVASFLLSSQRDEADLLAINRGVVSFFQYFNIALSNFGECPKVLLNSQRSCVRHQRNGRRMTHGVNHKRTCDPCVSSQGVLHLGTGISAFTISQASVFVVFDVQIGKNRYMGDNVSARLRMGF